MEEQNNILLCLLFISLIDSGYLQAYIGVIAVEILDRTVIA